MHSSYVDLPIYMSTSNQPEMYTTSVRSIMTSVAMVLFWQNSHPIQGYKLSFKKKKKTFVLSCFVVFGFSYIIVG